MSTSMTRVATPEPINHLQARTKVVRYWRLRTGLPGPIRPVIRGVLDFTSARFIGSIRGAQSTSEIALTIDDGPDPVTTRAIASVLQDRNVSATFFVLLENVRRHPDVVRALVDAGHDVELHGVDHRPIRDMESTAMRAYLASAKAELENVIEHPVRYYRPPFGAQSLRSYRVTRAIGLMPVLWSQDVADWEPREHEALVADGLATRPGGVLLFHDTLVGWPGRPARQVRIDRPGSSLMLLMGGRLVASRQRLCPAWWLRTPSD